MNSHPSDGNTRRGLPLWLIAAAIFGTFAAALTLGGLEASRGRGGGEPRVAVLETPPEPAGTSAEPALDKKALAEIIGSRSIATDDHQILGITGSDGGALFVRTTILPSLQSRASEWVNASQAREAALVAIRPETGEVLALAGYRADGGANAALAGSFPAASLFKIVTAAAAVEKADFSAESTVAYDGGKHTLFKGNVVKEPNEGHHAATLKESFAESINTVFGKMGAFTLGPGDLSEFAGRFGFNADIEFEMPVEASTFALEEGEDPFRLAELASGFNRATRVSPLHGAMMAGAVANGGLLRKPSFVREVFDRENRIYYKAGAQEAVEAVSPETARELSALMVAAVREGTGRRTFRRAADHPVLSRLEIGGKSGTINNDAGERVDWFVAWARPLKDHGDEKDSLALSAVVVHNGVTKFTSQELVRDALALYYEGRVKKTD
jgi:membrane peptidoglycan carboxypeptidase